MPASVKVGGTWQALANASVKVAGAWEQVSSIKVKVAGVWQTVWENIRVIAFGTSINSTQISPTNAFATYQMLAAGDTNRITNTGTINLGTWLVSGAAADYDVRYSPTGDTGSMSGAAINTWLSLASNRFWTLTTSSDGTLNVSGTIEIRDASTLVVLDSATVTMNCERTP